MVAIGHYCYSLVDFLKQNSPLKSLRQLSRNLVGRIIGRPSIKIAHLAVSEKIFLEIDQSERRITCGGHLCERVETK
jgi:hypothetical protein